MLVFVLLRIATKKMGKKIIQYGSWIPIWVFCSGFFCLVCSARQRQGLGETEAVMGNGEGGWLGKTTSKQHNLKAFNMVGVLLWNGGNYWQPFKKQPFIWKSAWFMNFILTSSWRYCNTTKQNTPLSWMTGLPTYGFEYKTNRQIKKERPENENWFLQAMEQVPSNYAKVGRVSLPLGDVKYHPLKYFHEILPTGNNPKICKFPSPRQTRPHYSLWWNARQS